MTRRTRLLLALSLAVMIARPAAADDKDFLRPIGESVPPNLLIVFGNSQTTTQPINFLNPNIYSTFDGDGDSPGSKLGSAKRVVKQFVADHHLEYNIGLTSFSRPPNLGSTDINRKHWVYEALDTDFPNDTFKEVGRNESVSPATSGTLHRWGLLGEGPCTSKTVPPCTDVSPAVQLNSSATIVGPFFGPQGNGVAYIYLNGNANNATERIKYTMTAGEYGDAFTNAFTDTNGNGTRENGEPLTLAALMLGDHSIEVTKEFQTKQDGVFAAPLDGLTTVGRTAAKVIVRYRPPVAFPKTLFYTETNDPQSAFLGRAVGFLNEPKVDFDVNTNCSGWEFQQNSGQVPLIKIPRDYYWGQACNAPQNSLPCVNRLLRPQAYIETYDRASGAFTTADLDNPGYTGAGSKYADGCDPNLLGAVQNGLDDVERTVILSSRNGSQAPIKNILGNILAYFKNPAHDGFQNGARLDDPNAVCRNSAVIFIYDTFNGCQNDSCSFLKNSSLNDLRAIGIPVYVIGFGAQANSGVCAANPLTDTCPLVCIAEHSGALKLDGSPGYFPVTSDVELLQALLDIGSLINESQKGFVASSVSTAQASGEQVTFLSTFSATSNRSIWNGRVNAYKLDSNGNLTMGLRKIDDPNDPFSGATVPAPSNARTSLMWNAGENLGDTPGTGATNPSAVLQPGAVPAHSTYVDGSNIATSVIDTNYFPGRKIVFSLPQTYPVMTDPATTLPIPAADAVPENRFDMIFNTSATWWPALRALLSPQAAPPQILNPPISDTNDAFGRNDARDTLRFVWGDRDAVILATQPNAVAAKLYSGLKLGDIFHSSPILVGRPNNFPYFTSNLNGYQDFLNTYGKRRRVLYVGSNDGLLHAFDAGGWDRKPTVCDFEADGVTRKHCYDLGTGTELFAYAPRTVMQIFKGMKDTLGPQTRRIQWSVDGPPTAGDVFIDSSHDGTPVPANRAWHTVLVGGMREGTSFQGTPGTAPANSLGSYYALDITQPDELTTDANGKPLTVIPATDHAPLCLNADGDATCGKDAADATVRSNQPARPWPSVLWEITDTEDLDTGGPGDGFVDMGESWSKPSLGRVKVCTLNCGNTTAPFPVNEDRYVAVFGGGFDRERLNRRGNWLYMIDVETGKVLYRANSSCGINDAGGCSPTYFASIPSEPAAIDGNGDGYIDLLYFGDLKGRMWKVDLTDLRLLSSPPSSRWDNQLDLSTGSGRPFLLFEAPQPVSPAVHPFYPIYYRPTVITLGYNVSGRPALGIGFGTGDRDDITSRLEPLALTFKQRFYYVVDRNNSTTLTESGLYDITSATAPSITTAPTNGWFIELAFGERINADSITVGSVIFFTTFNPLAAGNSSNPCAANSPECGLANGTARLYRVSYTTGNPYLGSDRGQVQTLGGFLSEPVYFQSRDQQGNLMYTTENTVKKEAAPGGKRTTVKSWKERSRRP
jgi:Tfp pilus tip-associated adhesin PilY1